MDNQGATFYTKGIASAKIMRQKDHWYSRGLGMSSMSNWPKKQKYDTISAAFMNV